ncbi:MAG: tyrosine-type recombinase/integrase [Anaerolineae bacterium]|nr:tyrosine-type recombinase/integrase [Anaerolineae bacterium]MCK4473190.1 tyrosine-type recombinase/integrase [Anaerolineae bacterium]
MGSPPLITSSLPQEDELLLGDYEHYLKLWSFRHTERRLAVARDLLHWWQEPLDQLRPEDLALYLQCRSKSDRSFVRTFTLFLERTGRLPAPRPPDPADVPLPGVAAPASRLVGEFLRMKKRNGQTAYNRSQDWSRLKLFLQILPTQRQMELGQVTHHDIEAFIEQQQDRELAATTINRRLSVIRGFFAWLGRVGQYTDDNPVRDDHYLPEPDPLPRAMATQEVVALLTVIDDVMDRAIFLVLLRTGIRVGELLRLTVADVDPAQATLYIQMGGKNSRGRVVYLFEDAHQALTAWLKERQRFNVEPLFFTRRSHRLCRQTVEEHFQRYLKAAGIRRHYTVHCLRHTFATDLLNVGVPITTLQELLGHVSIAITQRYARLSDATKRHQYFAAMQHIQESNLTLWPADNETQEVGDG